MNYLTFFGKHMDMDKLTTSIKQHEGFRPYLYKDTTSNWTIGYGRNLSARGITQPEAQMMLQNDIQLALAEASTQTWWSHVMDNDARSRAMVEMIFNMGLATLQEFHVATLCLCNNDYSGAATAFLDSSWAREVGDRAVELTQMISTGEDAV